MERRLEWLSQRLAEPALTPGSRHAMVEEKAALTWLLDRANRVQELVVGVEMVMGVTAGTLVTDGNKDERIMAICKEVLRIPAEQKVGKFG